MKQPKNIRKDSNDYQHLSVDSHLDIINQWFIISTQSDTVVHTCNPSTVKAEAGGTQVPGQSKLHTKTLPQK
jgi:hypothetical protein